MRVLINSQSGASLSSLETTKGWQKVACRIKRRGHHYRCLGRGLPLTLPNVRQVNGRDHRLRPNLDRGVLPGQQVMVRCRNSVKVDT